MELVTTLKSRSEWFVVIFLWNSFAEGNVPARITQAGEIDSKTIAERFES